LAIAVGEQLARLVVAPEDVIIQLLEVTKENWSFGDGIAHYVDAAPQ
jgi:hypothetical protein